MFLLYEASYCTIDLCNVSGSGTALIGGAASSEDTTFAAVGDGMLKLDHSSAYTGTVSGFNEGDRLDIVDVLSGTDTTLVFTANQAGSGGTLTVSDGMHTANISLNGQYSANGFHISADSSAGTLVTYLPLATNTEPLI
jgi:hypothetical protein